MFLEEQDIPVSPVYIDSWQFSQENDRSLLKIRKNGGPKQEPCGTPFRMMFISSSTPLNLGNRCHVLGCNCKI